MSTNWIAEQLDSGAIDPKKLQQGLSLLRTRQPQYFDYANGNEHFAFYLRIVDAYMRKWTGWLTHRDFSDYAWFDAYANGTRPTAAAKDALKADDLLGTWM